MFERACINMHGTRPRKSGTRRKGTCDVLLHNAKDKIGVPELGLKPITESLIKWTLTLQQRALNSWKALRMRLSERKKYFTRRNEESDKMYKSMLKETEDKRKNISEFNVASQTLQYTIGDNEWWNWFKQKWALATLSLMHHSPEPS